MSMLGRVNAPKDILAGLIFVAFGLGTFALARGYEIGTAVKMGPGYFPAAMGLVLAVIGLAAIVRGILSKAPDPITPHRLEPLALIFAGILAFSFLIERAGLVIAAAALIGIACLRRLRTNPLEVLIIYLVLTGFSALVFVEWFDMRLPLFWWR
jgi:Tripartite tricarboxylate transporter TctB family